MTHVVRLAASLVTAAALLASAGCGSKSENSGADTVSTPTSPSPTTSQTSRPPTSPNVIGSGPI